MSEKKLFILSLVLMLSALVLLVLFQIWNNVSEEAEVSLSGLIGKVYQDDTQITLLAQMALHTRDQEAEANYRIALGHYQQDIQEILRLVPDGNLRSVLYRTLGSQRVTVALDLRALALCHQQSCDQALQLLDSKLYQHRKLEATLGLESALQEFQREERLQNDQTQHALFGLELILVFATSALIYFWRRSQASQLRMTLSQTRLTAMQVTMRTVMDVVNNNLNRLRLLQLRWKKSERLSPEELQDFSRLIQETAIQLKAIGDLEDYATHGEGPTELLNLRTNIATGVSPS
jgi:hypothetical protein